MPGNIDRFAERYQLKILGRLGFGVHGSVYEMLDARGGKTAVKIHNELEHFLREFEVYQRLDESAVDQVCGFWVPQLLRADEDFLALQMTMVARPYVLDFAGAYLDQKPQFPDEVWAEWESQKRDQFGERWKIVCQVLDALEELRFFMWMFRLQMWRFWIDLIAEINLLDFRSREGSIRQTSTRSGNEIYCLTRYCRRRNLRRFVRPNFCRA